MQPPELPPKYYLEYFQYLIQFVQRKYDPILNEAEQNFLQKFNQLTEDEQCLFIRFTNRTGVFFKTDKLKYAEIENIPQVLTNLIEKQFIEILSPSHASRIGELLDIFTKTELLNQAKMLGLDIKGKGSLKKEEVMDFLLENVSSQEIIEVLSEERRAKSEGGNFSDNKPNIPSATTSYLIPHTSYLIKVAYEQEVMMFKFLFFGSRHGDMTEFVIRDLGFRQYQTFDEEKLVAYFSTRQEAEDKLKVSLAREDFQLMVDAQLEPLQIYTWFMDWTDVHKPHLSEIALPTYERLTLKVGAYLERQKQHDHALTVFRFTQQTPSRERQVRILYKDKNLSEAQALCEQILIDYQNADEQFFAIDYLNRFTAEAQKKKAKKATTLQLDNSSMVSIDIGWKYRVEMGVIDYYNRKEINAVHSENFLWRSFFGLLFWDIIFDTETLAIHHPLQRSPSDLYKPIFWEKRRNRLVERLELLDRPEELNEYLLQI